MADWLTTHYGLAVPVALGAVAVWLMAPRVPHDRTIRAAGLVAGLAALVTGGLWLVHPAPAATQAFLFYLFAAGAVAAGAMMITDRNPVYAALWFALATLCVCGLFLLRSAPFLAAATVIVYAGAIIVTFLFVIMLAQQHGSAIYDLRAVRPLPTVAVAFALLGGMLYTIEEWRGEARPPGAASADAAAEGRPRVLTSALAAEANPLSRPIPNAEFGSMRGLGRSLFGDYLFAVEIAGTLLLVAAVGAIALSPRRSQGNL